MSAAALRRGFVALVCLLVLPGPVPAVQLPAGFSERVVVTGITGATAMEIAPNGLIFICEQTGSLRVVKDGQLLPRPFLTVTVDSSWERGLLGLAFDPDFARNQFVYVNYIPPKPYPHHRVSRFTADGDTAVPGSEVVLFEGDDQNQLGGGVKNGHQGGALHFGPDGKLYLAIGDQTAGEPAQSLKTLQGKVLRLNSDGSIPADNPFYNRTTGKYRAIWALGCRNPFTFAFQPGTGRMFINDVGGANEEINEGAAGANYGWPTADHGPTADRRYRGPIYWYKESSIAGGAFYDPPVSQFPPQYAGKYFFGDFKVGWIKVLDPDHPNRVTDFATGLGERTIVDIKLGPDGSLYYLDRNAWVNDKDFRPNTGRLHQVRYTGNRTPPGIVTDPVNRSVAQGKAVTFRVKAAGTAPLAYQWLRNDRPIPGARSATYELPIVGEIENGAQFSCRVSNAFGNVTSSQATLIVKSPNPTAPPWISPRPGRYTGPITVRLSTELLPGTIHYTTDGSEPGEQSAVYRQPFAVTATVTVKLRSIREGRPTGPVRVARFSVEGTKPYGLPYAEPARTVKMPLSPENVPSLLSQTGVFASLADLRPNPGVIPYDVTVPLWSDGAAKQRWIVLPPGERIGFAATGEWLFPAGTVFVKHFELATDASHPEQHKRLETRLLVVDETGNGYGVTYRWRPDGRDAVLLLDSQTEKLTVRTPQGPRTQEWYYPSRADCLACHTPAAKFVLGVKTRQLNRTYTYPGTHITDNQLRTWNYLGLFDPPMDERQIPAYHRLVAPREERATLEDRVRSYLDANCAHCHRPGNPVRAALDVRYETPLGEQGLLSAPTVSDSLGLRDPRVIAPGDLRRSMLFDRLTRADHYKMPPLARNVRDEQALDILRQWINSLPKPLKGRGELP
jgi:uncharacterized repeat protein (TIGR03806 family)